MAVKIHPGQAKEAIAQQAAVRRRGAPGKRFVGDAGRQSAAAKLAERKRALRMAEVDAARRRAEEIGEPISAILAELVQDALRLARTLAAAPFRIALALRSAWRPREARPG